MSAPRLDARDRAALLRALSEETHDLLVIGGGISGAGIARDAALRGLSVALVEAEDFAAGTSNRSTKLIHGGLRYLAMGDIALVRETALERKAVHAMAPHLAEPCWMVVPGRSRTALLKYRAGITAYEKLGAVVKRDLHRNWNSDDLARAEPHLDRQSFPHAVAYREYLTDDARLVVATLRAATGAGAHVASRLRVEGLLRDGERVTGVQARCGHSDEIVEVHARTVVNAAGPWAEQVAGLEAAREESRLHLSKGVHIVLPASRLPVRNLTMMNTLDGRTMFAIPRGEVVYLGTTDTSWHGDDPLWPSIDLEDVTYLLEPASRYFDVPRLEPTDVVAAWAGLRPLIAAPGKEAKELSRKDEVWVGSGGMITVAGGKLTGFRKMAEEVMHAVARDRDETLPDSPGPTVLPGGAFEADVDALAAGLRGADNLGAACTRRLASLYGAEASEVLALGAEPLVTGGEVLRGEIDWAVGTEAADTLEDLVYRRTRAAWYRPTEREALLEPAADRMGELLGWDEARRTAEIARVRAQFAHELAFLD